MMTSRSGRAHRPELAAADGAGEDEHERETICMPSMEPALSTRRGSSMACNARTSIRVRHSRPPRGVSGPGDAQPSRGPPRALGAIGLTDESQSAAATSAEHPAIRQRLRTSRRISSRSSGPQQYEGVAGAGELSGLVEHRGDGGDDQQASSALQQ